MKRPIIGITLDCEDDGAHYESPFTYAQAVEKGGGLPILFPYRSDLSIIPDFVDLVDGLLFSGGNDLDPSVYGQTWHKEAKPIDPDRQSFEMALLAEVERRRVPTLGICLGSQLMNVYRGGSLNQFLPDIPREPFLEHRKVGDVLPRHNVTLDPNSVIGQAIGKTEISANSYHKQAVDRLGRGLRVIATAPDGVIEGFEDPSADLFAAVQWHPERLAAEEPDHLALFRLLTEKAREFADRKG
jgi:putative glutamine amidotransferase